MSVSPSQRLARYWNRQADGYDRKMARLEQTRLGESRRWVCERARGEVLVAGIGTGLDLTLLPREARATGLDLSERMLEVARGRATALGRGEDRFVPGDAMALPFAASSFDAVLCTFALCSVPEPARALREFRRVLRPDGLLLLADHVRSSNPIVRMGQRLLEAYSIPAQGEHYTRRPSALLADAGFEIVEAGRHTAGIIEHLSARPI